MARTRIIGADGISYRPEGTTRRTFRRGIVATFTIIGLLFLSAAVIGFAKAATAPTPHTPTQASLTALHNAEKGGAKNCRLEWNEVQGNHEVICGNSISLSTLRALASRPATAIDPNGNALIAECLSDTGLSDQELIFCLSQPKN